jgi:hypothetical protein
MAISVKILVVALAILGYVTAPIMLVWGWTRWARQQKRRTASSILSLVGFALATASASLAVCLAIYARVIGGFPYYHPLLMRTYATGTLLSLGGILFGLAGIWRWNSLRWHAPVAALATLAFWLLSASME